MFWTWVRWRWGAPCLPVWGSTALWGAALRLFPAAAPSFRLWPLCCRTGRVHPPQRLCVLWSGGKQNLLTMLLNPKRDTSVHKTCYKYKCGFIYLLIAFPWYIKTFYVLYHHFIITSVIKNAIDDTQKWLLVNDGGGYVFLQWLSVIKEPNNWYMKLIQGMWKYCTVLYLITILRCLYFSSFYSTHLFQNLKKTYCQKGFYTNKEFVLVNNTLNKNI